MGALGGACLALGVALSSDSSLASSQSSSSLSSVVKQQQLQQSPLQSHLPSKRRPAIFTLEEVAKHNTRDSVLVTFKDGVYDVTEFVDAHPGGADRLMMAAGAAVDPFWALYQQHMTDDVQALLKGYRVGRLSEASIAEAKKARAKDPADPYRNEPEGRHPALVVRKQKPFNAETPMTLLTENFLTPNALWYVRHHHPVPVVDVDTYRLEIAAAGTSGGDNVDDDGSTPPSLSLSMDDLRDASRFPRASVTTTVQCAGNRRGGLNKVAKTQGLDWDCGAVGTAVWTGVWLRDVLAEAGLSSMREARGRGVKHVQFLPLDPPYDASIPVKQALDDDADVLLAFEMNGEVLPREHGFPLRAIVPGSVGARNVKWVSKIVPSAEEAGSTWQRGIQYRGVSPNVASFKGLDPQDPSVAGPPVYQLPVQSAICKPANGAVVDVDVDDPEAEVEVSGFAWSGGGRKVVRVDVSADDGATWHTATLKEGSEQESEKAWAWTLWEATVPVGAILQAQQQAQQQGSGKTTESKGPLRLVCRAVDESYNVQPDKPEALWNLRGILNNSWHRISVAADQEGESSWSERVVGAD